MAEDRYEDIDDAVTAYLDETVSERYAVLEREPVSGQEPGEAGTYEVAYETVEEEDRRTVRLDAIDDGGGEWHVNEA